MEYNLKKKKKGLWSVCASGMESTRQRCPTAYFHENQLKAHHQQLMLEHKEGTGYDTLKPTVWATLSLGSFSWRPGHMGIAHFHIYLCVYCGGRLPNHKPSWNCLSSAWFCSILVSLATLSLSSLTSPTDGIILVLHVPESHCQPQSGRPWQSGQVLLSRQKRSSN